MTPSIGEAGLRLLALGRVYARAEIRQLCELMIRDPDVARRVAPLFARVVLEYVDAERAAGL